MAGQLEEILSRLLVPDNATIQEVCELRVTNISRFPPVTQHPGIPMSVCVVCTFPTRARIAAVAMSKWHFGR